MDPDRLQFLQCRYFHDLLGDSVPFWMRHAIDRDCGGFHIMLDRDGSRLDDDKGVWTQCRFAWLLATLYNEVEQREDWLEAALHGIDFIERHCFDSDGRMFFHLTREGRPIRKRRYAFTDCFGAMAYAAVARATDRDEFAARAISCFETFRSHRPDPKFTPERPSKSIGEPMISIGVAQALRETIGWDEADSVIDDAIDEIRLDFVKPGKSVVMETTGPAGEIIDHFDGRLLNPGHAIEAAWFIMAEGKRRASDDLIQLGARMLDFMWERGWDKEHGGLFYFRDLDDRPIQEYWHDMKFWWPHNEAIIATLLAYQLTGEARFSERHQVVDDWAHEHFADPEFGEWFGYLHRDGRVSTPLKGNLWKGPFHLPRMQLICGRIVDELSASANPRGSDEPS